MHLGASATETKIKDLSASGALKSYRVLHFATHGLVAGETQSLVANMAEPALLLTPPQTASDEDDGLLTASEVAKLNIDADWAILSACNTAAADGTQSAEALSGLASSFLYAGTRSLIVSHWYVNSEAAVQLVTGTFGALRKQPGIGRAEAEHGTAHPPGRRTGAPVLLGAFRHCRGRRLGRALCRICRSNVLWYTDK